MNTKYYLIVIVLFLLAGCKYKSIEIENLHKGELNATFDLQMTEEKKFILDDETAPMPIYTQLYCNDGDHRYFTFFNNFNNSIYFYDYDSLSYQKKITWEKEGPNGVKAISGYHIKSKDSIYLYNTQDISIKLANDKAEVFKSISLIGTEVKNLSNWYYRVPQYYIRTITPLIETKKEILLTGYFFGSVPDTCISNFNITSRFDFNMNNVQYSFGYPESLYGSNYNWEHEYFTFVYYDLSANENELVFSFPVSHNIYLGNLETGEYREVYGGSNFAGSIRSITKEAMKTPSQEITANVMKQDTYFAIKYDKYRDVYYRFMLKAMPVSSGSMNLKEKPIAVIIMDGNFNYLGETVIGTSEDWNFDNIFVTEEGLNIEYIEKDFEEVYLTLKIFTVKKI